MLTSRQAILAIVLAGALEACATTATGARIDEEVLSTTENVALPSSRVPRADIALVGSNLAVDLQMERRCEFTKTENIRYTERITYKTNHFLLITEYVIGALFVAGGGISLAVAPGRSGEMEYGQDSSPRSRAFGAGFVSLAVGIPPLVAGLIDSSRASGTIGTTSNAERVAERHERECGRESGASIPLEIVVQRTDGGSEDRFFLGSTNDTGRLEADLATTIPYGVFAVAEPPKTGTVTYSGGSLGTVDLEAVASKIENNAWSEVGAEAVVDTLRSFLRIFPWSPHRAEARQRIVALQKEEVANAWAAAESTTKVAELEAFIEAYPESPRAADACARIVGLAIRSREFVRARATIDRMVANGVLTPGVADEQRARVADAAGNEVKRQRGVVSDAVKLSTRCSGLPAAGRKEIARSAHQALRSVRKGLDGGDYRDAESAITANCQCSTYCAGLDK